MAQNDLNRLKVGHVSISTMKTHRVILAAATLGISVLAVSSCVYEPYYSGSSRSYGYGSPSFSTLHFVRTSNPRWGYDPRVRCYYDYHRRCYYDPYLSGYYPVGYRPVYVRGVPHPHGWNGGHRHISPPSRIRDYRLGQDYQRQDRYRHLNHDWSRHIQVKSDPRVDYSRRLIDSNDRSEIRSDRFSNTSFNQRRDREREERVIRVREDNKLESRRESRQRPEINFRQQERQQRVREERVAPQRYDLRRSEPVVRGDSNPVNIERPERSAKVREERNRTSDNLREQRISRPKREP